MTAIDDAIASLEPHLDTEIGVSKWFDVPQARIDAFADITEDHQFIHIDPERAKAETPFGGTIAHGFLTLSLASAMVYDVIPFLEGQTAGLNYGFEKIRFLSPVPAGARIRGRFTLMQIKKRNPQELQRMYQLTIEIEGHEKPAMVAEWISLSIF